ncbi:D-alanine--D-alanine ligase [bacterium]|nr:MAG: D-alanine--D-alanine ligase [bacterium]
MGGVSEEREISLRTGTAVLNALLDLGYTVSAIDAGADLPARVAEEGIKTAFIALHGRFGEDGCVQGLLEVMGIPYTGSGVRASSIAMDKLTAKKIFEYHGIRTPKLSTGTGKFKLPLMVKPAGQGSAIGISVVRKKAGLKAAVTAAKAYGSGVVIEEFIEGRELTVAVLDKEALPVIEIRPKGGLYDYKAKYTSGMTDFVVPAKLKKSAEAEVKRQALLAYNALGCSGAARVDIMLSKRGLPYVLEVNTVPGLTELSLFPKAAAAVGITYKGLVERMLMGASTGKF